MLEAIERWIAALSMEKVFIVTCVYILLLGVGLGLLVGRVFEKENERGEKDG